MAITSDQIIALAGLSQAVTLVNDLATKGQCNDADFKACIDSLFVFDPKTTLDVFAGDLSQIHTGLTVLSNLLSSREPENVKPIIRYMLGLLVVQKKATQNKDMMAVLHSRLTHIERNQALFDETQVSEKLSAVYQDTLSTLKNRILVTGNLKYLKTVAISDKIRALLLSGFRSALLWRQLGGSKWHFILSKSKIETASKALLNSSK